MRAVRRAVTASLLSILALTTPTSADDLEKVVSVLRAEIPDEVVELLISKYPPRLRGNGRPASPYASRADRLYDDRADSVVIVVIGGVLGGGVVVSDRGHVVTSEHVVRNAHVVGGGAFVTVSFRPHGRRRIENRGEFHLARVIARDVQHDLALLQLVQPPTGRLTVAPLATAVPAIGRPVFAIGHSPEYLWSLTIGNISNVHEKGFWMVGNAARSAATIQTQTPVSPGSSGGPLLDEHGDVVGIILGSSPQTPILNLAIQVRHVRDLVRQHAGTAGPSIGRTVLPTQSQLLISRKAAQ